MPSFLLNTEIILAQILQSVLLRVILNAIKEGFMGELRKIPNIGKATERDLTEMGYTTIESLKGKSAQQLYEEECALRGYVLDRCQLYLYRAVEYWLNTAGADPRRCRWWYFMDEYIQPSPCGAVCAACARFPDACGGCRSIKGQVWWLAYAGMERCPVYDCCVNGKGQGDCGGCPQLPCDKFMYDPTISDEQNESNLAAMLKNLGRK